MPIYEYKCDSCESILEAIQKFSDPPLDKCPRCGGRLKKLISQTSFTLKGDGWYINDYPSKERKDALEKEKKSTEPAEKASKETKSSENDKKEKKKEVAATTA